MHWMRMDWFTGPRRAESQGSNGIYPRTKGNRDSGCHNRHQSPHERTSKERLGYPTQKPLALYERLITASSNEGDIVLDPFCGCGTTIDAAHTLKRQWMGIDITILALDPMRQRLANRHGLEPSIDYQIEGYPTNMQEVRKLLKEGDKRKYHDFSNWAVTRLGLNPTKDVGDGGLDGVGHVTL